MKKEKVALITGGFRGIGKALAEHFCQQGYHVVAHGRKITPSIEEWAKHLSERYQLKVILSCGDFQDSATPAQLFHDLDSHFDHIDVLINNAGFENYYAAEELPLEEWQAVIQVNLTAAFLCSQLAAQRMKKAQIGSIINITSIHDNMPRKGLVHYCVSKAGLHMLTKATALEWAEYGIRVNSIGAGAIETDMNREAIDNFGREKFNHWIPLGRIGNTNDVAHLALFLADERSSYITGADYYIDGGYKLNTVRYDDRPGRH